MRNRRLLTAPLLLALCAACESGTAPSDSQIALGTYTLRSIDGQALPAPAPCGVFQIREAQLSLRSGRRAEYQRRYAPLSGGSELSFSGTGIFEREGDRIVVSLQGRWSNRPDPSNFRMLLESTPGMLLRHGVGGACDASSTERYELQ